MCASALEFWELELGSLWGHIGSFTVPSSGHQLCPLWAIISPKSCCPGFPPLPLVFHTPPHTQDPHTRLLFHAPWFSAHETLITSYLSFPSQAQLAHFRAVLFILFFSFIGLHGCVEEPMGTGNSFCPTRDPRGTDLLVCSPHLFPT
jgi:hypothetical protein